MTLAKREDCRDLLLIALAWFWPGALVSSRGPGYLARLLGDFAYLRLRAKRRGVAARIAAALGGTRPAAEIDRHTREVFRSAWAHDEVFCVESFARSASRWKTICARLHLEGLHHLQEALARGRGAILWESGFGQRALAKIALIEQGFRLTQVHGSAHGGSESWVGQHVIRPLYRRAAESLYEEIVDIQDGSLAYLRHLALRLRRNGVVCIMSLGRIGQKFAPVELLGERRYLATGALSLARTSGAALIPIFCFRDGDGTQRLVLEPPLTVAPADGSETHLLEAATAYARMLEGYVLRHPGQWPYWFPPPRTQEFLDRSVPVASE